MSINAIIDSLRSFLVRELKRVTEDRDWLTKHVSDAEKLSKRMDYQDSREQKLTLLIAVLDLLDEPDAELRKAAVQTMLSFLERELEQVQKDSDWIRDNIMDSERREKRLSYQGWRNDQLIILYALVKKL
jgi:oligoendopeptidase F